MIASVAAWVAGGAALGQGASSYESLQAEGARLYAERSFALALEAWEKAREMGAPEADKRTLEFYIADAKWRATDDASVIESARRALEALVEADPDDLIAAEAREALGDSWWADKGGRNWAAAWPFYDAALAYWAASSDLDLARVRYLGIVWKATGPPTEASNGVNVPLDVLANAREIAETAEDKSRAHFFLGVWHEMRGYDPFSIRRAGREFAAAVAGGEETAVFEAALFRLAEWNLRAGASSWMPGGNLVLQPNYDEALKLFRQFLTAFPRGQSVYSEQAELQIAEITRPVLELGASHSYLPGGAPTMQVRWRNLTEIELAIFRVDFPGAFQPDRSTDPGRWQDALKTDSTKSLRKWKETEVVGQQHATREKRLDLGKIDEPGVYLVEARSGDQRAREVVFVTSGAVLLNAVGPRVIGFFCDAQSGLSGSQVAAALWTVRRDEGAFVWAPIDGAEVEAGLLDATLPADLEAADILLLGAVDNQPVFARGNTNFARLTNDDWRVLAITDRAAFRPGEMVSWKLTARKRNGQKLTTPAGEMLRFRIRDPRNEVAHEGEIRLTDFGTAWGTYSIPDEAVLGMYSMEIEFDETTVATQNLFRVEAYRLPEFKVSLAPIVEKNAPVRLGDPMVVRVVAEYYFGGPAVDAEVRFVARQSPHYRVEPLPGVSVRSGPRVYPEGPRPSLDGQVVMDATKRTGPDGVVEFELQTPLDSGSDLRYDFEARVVDGSGREVVATGEFVVGRQGYFVNLTPSTKIALPGGNVDVAVSAVDGNDRPQQAKGILSFTRETWDEVWLDPTGREVSGDELAKLKETLFPPYGQSGWRLKTAEYRSEEVQSFDLETSAVGSAVQRLVLADAGFYRIQWQSPDGDGPPVVAETQVWVTAPKGALLGYKSNGIEVIADASAAKSSGKFPVLITSDSSNRDVLFLVSAGQDLLFREVIRLEGTSRLVELEIDDRYIPNAFLAASSIRGLQVAQSQIEVDFPPTEQVLHFEILPTEGEFVPGAESTLDVRVTDHEGLPVRAEFSLSVSDEAIAYIQADESPEPIEFFFGDRRPNWEMETSSIQWRTFWLPEVDAGIVGVGAGRRDRSTELGLVFDGAITAGQLPMGRFVMDQMAVAAPAARSAEMPASDAKSKSGAAAEIQVRQDFRASAFWQPNVITGDGGEARVKFRYPDSLTTWDIVARGATTGAQFGSGTATARTTKPLIARLQAPRFLVAGDSTQVGAVVNNRTNKPLDATVELTTLGVDGETSPVNMKISSGADESAAWRVMAPSPGSAQFTLLASGGGHSDGLTQSIPVNENGIERFVFAAGRTDGSDPFTVDLPAERKPGSERLVVTVTPSPAAAMLDALPYLIEFPYGCVEQTMSRFLPAAAAARTLRDLGVPREQLEGRVFGGIDPSAAPASGQGLSKLDEAVEIGLRRLADMQNSDGSWGWWKGGESDKWMTAYVVWGLRIAQQSGIGVRQSMIDQGASWLRLHLVDAVNAPELQSWMLHSLASLHSPSSKMPPEERAAFDLLWGKRDQLTAYGRALLTICAVRYDEKNKAETLTRNLQDGAVRDADSGISASTGVTTSGGAKIPTAHWGQTRDWHRWQDGAVETTAFALWALILADPTSDLVEPSMNWLLVNRQGARWSNTRDSAIAILALNAWLKSSRELGEPVSFELTVNGETVAEVENAAALDGQSIIEIPESVLVDGENQIVLRSPRALMLSAALSYFSLEQPIPPAGNLIFVKRDYDRFLAKQTLLNGFTYDRLPWKLDAAASKNERVEVTLTIEAKNNLEYLMIEDLKPAGLESVSVQSGMFMTAKREDGMGVPVYCELRDRAVVLFISELPQGVWKIQYDLRAETPGDFSALPVIGHAMYAPDVRGNSASRRVQIE